MSIIEKALKKAGQQGLVVEGGKKISSDTINPEQLEVSEDLHRQFDGEAFVRHQSDKTSVYVGSVQENYVAINWGKLAEDGFLDNENTKSEMAEEFRVIKRPLVNNIQTAQENGINRSNLILICSSLPNEGKTFISINLALSIANERDKNVLLIDADVEKPSVSKQLGIKQSPGLIEYLEDEKVKFSDIVLKTDLPNLSVIPAGKRHKYSTEFCPVNECICLPMKSAIVIRIEWSFSILLPCWLQPRRKFWRK